MRDAAEINEAFLKSPGKNAGLKAVDKEAGETMSLFSSLIL